MHPGHSKIVPDDDTLARSCGQLHPLSLSVACAQEKKLSKFVIEKPFAFIGRHAGCDICLPHADVTKQHAYLQVLDGRLYCVDQASRGGVSWKDKQRLYGWIDVGEWIEIGPYRITLLNRPGEVDCPAQGARNTAPFQARTDRTDAARLEVNGSLIIPLQRQMTTIGRSEYCNVQFDHEDVSRIHANVLRTSDGRYWVIDLISRTGVRINSVRCHVALLKDGDAIRIGTNTIRFQAKGSTTFSITKSAPGLAVTPNSAAVRRVEPRPSLSSTTPVDSSVDTPPLRAESGESSEPQAMPVRPEVVTESTLVSAEGPQTEPSADPFEEMLSEVIPTPDYPMVTRPKAELVRPPSSDAIARSSSRAARVQDRKQLARLQRRVSADNAVLMNMMAEHMRQMQQEMMTQMRMNMEMMVQCVHSMQKQQSEMVQAELAQLARINTELLQLKKELLTSPAQQGPAAEPRTHEARPSPEKVPVSPTKPLPSSRHPEPIPTTPAEADSSRHSHLWITQRIAKLETERKSRWQKIKEAVTRQ